MKQKLLNKDIITPLIIGLLFMWGFMHTLFYFQYSGIDSNVGFLDVWLLLVTSGSIMLMMSLVDMLPINFYKTDGEKFLFFHNNLSIFAKIFLVFSSASLLTLGLCLEPQSDLIDDYYDGLGWLVWLEYIFVGLFVLGIIGSIIVSIKNLIKDRNDSVYIDNELIKWFDNIEGETIINSQEIKKIEIEREISSRDDTPLGVQTIKIITQNESHIIDLDKMSLKAFGDKIEETIKITYPNIKTE
jgi:hypothetical protein